MSTVTFVGWTRAIAYANWKAQRSGIRHSVRQHGCSLRTCYQVRPY